MASQVSNHFLYQLMNKKIDLANGADTCKICLMATGYTFNQDTHATWADVSASELSGGSGYTAGGATLGTQTLTEDDTNDKGSVTWADVTWTASGGSIGPTPGAIIYDDTTSDDTVIGYIDFGGDKTATSGNTVDVTNIEVKLEPGA